MSGVLQRGHNGDGCNLASALCKYDLRKGDLFFLTWARVCEAGKYLLLLFATARLIVKSVKVPVVEVANRANRSHRIPP